MLKSIFKIGLLSFLLLFFFNSCKDKHVHEPHDDHFEAEGLALFQKGIKIAEIFRGVTRDTHSARVSLDGEFTEVKFFDKDKKLLNPPDYTKNPFSWQIADTSIVEIKQNPNQSGSYGFYLRGKKVGTTNIEFFIMHAGHADFRSGKMPIRVR